MRDFERLYNLHAGSLYSFLAYRTGDDALAEDLLADVFERALRARRRFDRRASIQQRWLYSLALEVLREHRSRGEAEQRALGRVHGSDGDPAGGLDAVEQRDSLDRALARLDEAEREAIALRYGAGLSLKEVAWVLRERQAPVEQRIRRGLVKLKGALAYDTAPT